VPIDQWPEDQRNLLNEAVRRGWYDTLDRPEAVATPWGFLSQAVWTKDEASGTIRQFPSSERYAYLRTLVDRRMSYPIFAVEKSRRMMATWLFLALYLFDVLTQRNLAMAVVSKKLEDSAYLLGPDRMLCIYERIPAEVWPNKPILNATGRHKGGYTYLECPATGSHIRAIASGPDQLRLYTLSRVFLDEFAFHERAEEEWTAVKPTVEGGGHIDLVSTPELGAYMYDLVHPGEAGL